MKLASRVKREGEPVAVVYGAEPLEGGGIRCGLLFVKAGQRRAVLSIGGVRLRLPDKLLGRGGHTCTYGAYLYPPETPR